MLRELRIANVAIIDDLTIRFGTGLNVITGETGAGKSILLRALALLCGGRATPDLVRGDTDAATIEGIFDVTLSDALADDLGIDADDEELIVRRRVARNGKGRIHVNGGAATASMLRRLSENLVHIYGQHEQALLLRPANHLDYLDLFGGLGDERAAMAAAYADLRKAQRRLGEVEERARSLGERRELLEFQRNELAGAALVEGEEAELRSDRERLRHAGRIQEVCSAGDNLLYAANDAMVTRLARLVSDLEGLSSAVAALSSPAELVEQARLLLEEAALQLRQIAGDARDDPSRLDEVEDRLALLNRLAKKYAAPSSELPAILAEVERELEDLENNARERGQARDAVDESLRSAVACATTLSKRRKKIGASLAKAMRTELASLGMEGGVFEVARETSAMAEIDDLTASGADRIEFFLSANRGEAPQALSRVASGGELSRILLALKSLTAGSVETPILIFDEVDAGIGGNVADAVARKLRLLAETHQVLCITHLPQIAARADYHFAVEKSERDGRTVSETRPLADEERVAELSRMLGGSSSDEAARYARELLAMGR